MFRRRPYFEVARRSRAALLPTAVLIMLVIVWEALVRADTSSYHIIPPPSAIFNAMINTRETLLTQHIPQTMLETLIGLALALVLGLGVAALLDFVPLLKRAIYPLLVISQTIPIFALAAVLIIAFGFGILPKVVV